MVTQNSRGDRSQSRISAHQFGDDPFSDIDGTQTVREYMHHFGGASRVRKLAEYTPITNRLLDAFENPTGIGLATIDNPREFASAIGLQVGRCEMTPPQLTRLLVSIDECNPLDGNPAQILDRVKDRDLSLYARMIPRRVREGEIEVGEALELMANPIVTSSRQRAIESTPERPSWFYQHDIYGNVVERLSQEYLAAMGRSIAYSRGLDTESSYSLAYDTEGTSARHLHNCIMGTDIVELKEPTLRKKNNPNAHAALKFMEQAFGYPATKARITEVGGTAAIAEDTASPENHPLKRLFEVQRKLQHAYVDEWGGTEGILPTEGVVHMSVVDGVPSITSIDPPGGVGAPESTAEPRRGWTRFIPWGQPKPATQSVEDNPKSDITMTYKRGLDHHAANPAIEISLNMPKPIEGGGRLEQDAVMRCLLYAETVARQQGIPKVRINEDSGYLIPKHPELIGLTGVNLERSLWETPTDEKFKAETKLMIGYLQFPKVLSPSRLPETHRLSKKELSNLRYEMEVNL